MKNSFKGGIWPIDHKYTLHERSERVADPEHVVLSLYQYDEVTALPIVKAGDVVYEGQMVADVPHGLGVPLHSPVSGTVRNIVPYNVGDVKSFKIVIDNDFQHIPAVTVKPFGKKLSESTIEEIVSVIRRAGIMDEYGAKNPIYKRILSYRGQADRLLVNCTEPEPFVTSRHRAVIENAENIINGAKILMMALGVREVVFGVEAIRKGEQKALRSHIQGNFASLAEVTSKYPVNRERLLVEAVTGSKTSPKKSAIDYGFAVFSAETCLEVYLAFAKGQPSIYRYVTLDGDCIETPRILTVPIGTPLSHLITSNGGLTSKPMRIVTGGPLSGNAITDEFTCVDKNTDAVLLLGSYFKMSGDTKNSCINCGKCVKVCPQGLNPAVIARMSADNRMDIAKQYMTAECLSCSACAFVCPGGVPLTTLITAVPEE